MNDNNTRRAGWLAALLIAAALTLPAVAAATGPGGVDNLPNSGHTSNTDGLTPTMLANATISCDAGNTVNAISGQFSVSGTGGVGTYVVIYLTPNNGSNASPIGNVENNEVHVDLAGRSGTIDYSLPVTSGFTATSGGSWRSSPWTRTGASSRASPTRSTAPSPSRRRPLRSRRRPRRRSRRPPRSRRRHAGGHRPHAGGHPTPEVTPTPTPEVTPTPSRRSPRTPTPRGHADPHAGGHADP